MLSHWKDCLIVRVLVLIYIFPESHSQSFTSIAKLQELPATERELITALRIYLGLTKVKTLSSRRQLENFLTVAQDSQMTAERDESFFEKPTNAFLYIRRLTEGWSHVTDIICRDQDGHDVESHVFCLTFTSVVQRSSVWPSTVDLHGAALAIIRLVEFYKLDFKDLAKGTIHTCQVAPLTVTDFLLIAEAAADDGRDHLAAVWISNSWRLLQKMAPTDRNMEVRLQRRLAALYYKHQMFSKATRVIKEVLRENPNHKGARRDLELFKKRLTSGDEPGEIPRRDFLGQFSDHITMYRKLCRGNVKTPLEASTLHCEYQQTRIPLIKSKVEYVNLVPPVTLIHDVATETDMEHMKNLTKSKLERSVVGEKKATSPVRISQTAWLGESNNVLMRMSRKVELHTGLSALYMDYNSHAEPWQVVNYGLGGLYIPHEDSVRPIRELGGESESTAMGNSGDRVATFLLYLNHVTLGGATVFPKLKARIPVVKGSAALWYNLHKNGDPDNRHLHAGCPVLIGSKWVANKWMREIGQAFRRPCATDKNL